MFFRLKDSQGITIMRHIGYVKAYMMCNSNIFRNIHKVNSFPLSHPQVCILDGSLFHCCFPSCCLHDTSRERRSDIGDWLDGPSSWGALGLIGCTFEPPLMPRHRALEHQHSFNTLHQHLHSCCLCSHMSCSMDISYTWKICILCMDWLTSWLPCCILYSHVLHDIWACALS